MSINITPGIFDEEDYCPRCKDFHKTSSCKKPKKVYPKIEEIIKKIKKRGKTLQKCAKTIS